MRPARALILVSVLLPVVLFGLAAWQNYREVLREADATVEKTVRTLHEHAVKVFEIHKLVIDQINGRLRFVDWMSEADAADVQGLLKRLQGELDQIATVTITDAEGRMRASGRAYPANPEVSFADRDWFQALREGDPGRPYVSRSYIGRQSGQSVFNVAGRVQGATDRDFAGAIAVSVDRTYFERFYRGVEPDLDHNIILMRADGQILARDPATGMPALPADSALMQAIGKAPDGAFALRSAIDGVDRIFGYRKVSPYPVYVGFGIARDAILASWWRNLRTYGLVAALASLALLAVSGLAIRQGRREDEANAGRELARSELKAANERLETTIAERTAELSAERERAVETAALREAILAQLAEGVILTDAEGRITFVNEAAARLHGGVRLDVPPDRYSESYQLFTVDGRPHPFEDLPLARAVLLGEIVEETRWRIRRPDGTEVLAIGNARPVFAPGGARLGSVLTLRDDTARELAERVQRRLNETLAEQAAELRESNEEMQRYAYIVSHDLRAPLVNITGFTSELETLRGEILEAGAKSADDPARGQTMRDFDESLAFIKAATTKMDGLINAILKLSREGRRTFQPEPLDMEALMRGLADAQRHQADEAEATITIGALPAITADRLAVEQVFGNLIDNAIKYAAPDRPSRIAINGEVRGGRVVYRVADNGRGIAASDHDRVFELFRRSGSQDRPGEGIGLAHVKALVRSLGGRIDLSSEFGQGTTFTVTLPRVPAQPPARLAAE